MKELGSGRRKPKVPYSIVIGGEQLTRMTSTL